MPIARRLSRVAVVSVALLGLPALAADSPKLTKDEFYAAAYYKQAIENPTIQKIKQENGKISAIARDIKMKPDQLKKAIEKVNALGGDPTELAVSAVKSALGSGRVKGRLIDVLINAEEPKHVVLYIRWTASSAQNVIKEAAEIAYTVASEAPFVSTLSLAANHPRSAPDAKDVVWSAKIGADRMGNIQPKRIDDYADRMYKPLFEVVDNKPF
jgi:DNA-binding phage protein